MVEREREEEEGRKGGREREVYMCVFALYLARVYV